MQEHTEPGVNELMGILAASSARTRARFHVILQCLARVLARLESRDERELMEELLRMVEQEMTAESEELKEYLRRPEAPKPSEG